MPLRWRRRLAVFAGGMAGGAARIGIGALLPAQDGWPWGTLVANVTGAALLAYLLTRFQQAGTRSTLAVPLVCIGVLGSYTTFSLYALEIWDLVEAGAVTTAAAYALVSVVGGLVAALAGIRLGERRR